MELNFSMDQKKLNNQLMNAIKKRNLVRVESLIKDCADVNCKRKGNFTPLHNAAFRGYPEIVQLLIDNGADVNFQDKQGKTALHDAQDFRDADYFQCTKILIENGADIKVKDKYGKTALHYAVGQGNLEIIKFLIDHGSDIDAQDGNGFTLLHVAADHGNIEQMQLLINNGAKLDIKDNTEKLFLDLADKFKSRIMVEFISSINDNLLLDAIIKSDEQRQNNLLF